MYLKYNFDYFGIEYCLNGYIHYHEVMGLPSNAGEIPSFTGDFLHVKNPSDDVLVTALSGNKIYRSCDFGKKWTCDFLPIPGDGTHNCFVTSCGNIIVQKKGWAPNKNSLTASNGRLYVFNKKLELISECGNGVSAWHSNHSISENNGTILYADYAANPPRSSDNKNRIISSNIFRSVDDGLTWQIVYCTDKVRHFHTLDHDPLRKKCWWATAGDEDDECIFLVSVDDGENWLDISPQIMELMKSIGFTSQRVLRATQILFTENGLIWGTDDLLISGSPFRGSRIFHLKNRFSILGLQEICRIGPEVRNLIMVDDLLLIFAGASKIDGYDHSPSIWAINSSFDQQAACVAKIKNEKLIKSALTYSRLSKHLSPNNIFYSFRDLNDGGYAPSRIVAWQLEINKNMTNYSDMLLQDVYPKKNYTCVLCGHAFDGKEVKGICSSCNSRPRVRSLKLLLRQHSEIPIYNKECANPVLGFSVSSMEAKLLLASFNSICSVSLYGKFYGDCVIGVDAKDLMRYADSSFSVHYSCLLFDYFVDHDRALSEAYRVLDSDGLFLTHLQHTSLLEGEQKPQVASIIKPKCGYYEYVPDNNSMVHIKVGRFWFLDAMKRAGFNARYFDYVDPSSGIVCTWFVGKKSDRLLDQAKKRSNCRTH